MYESSKNNQLYDQNIELRSELDAFYTEFTNSFELYDPLDRSIPRDEDQTISRNQLKEMIGDDFKHHAIPSALISPNESYCEVMSILVNLILSLIHI